MNSLVEIIQCSLELTAGCTEPAAVAFCGALAGQHLNAEPRSLALTIDRRTYKNGFGAGIPGAGERRGCEWALELGLIMACPEKRLSLFSSLTPEILARADRLHQRHLIQVTLEDSDHLLIHLLASDGNNEVEVRLRGGHTRVDRLRVNGRDLELEEQAAGQQPEFVFDESAYDPGRWPALIETLYGDRELRTLVSQAIAYNMAAALHGRRYLGEGDDSRLENLVMGAIYARMNGDPIPVMSCAGSGNKGLTCMIPVTAWARERVMGEEEEIRAVLLSIFLTTLITSRFGEVSSVCGAQYAAGAGVIGGLLQLKRHLDLFDGAYNNFVAAIGGGFCDGAKGSCSMRGGGAVTMALQAIDHAENGFVVSGRDGFLGNSFRETLDHLVRYNPIIARFERETIRILQEKDT